MKAPLLLAAALALGGAAGLSAQAGAPAQAPAQAPEQAPAEVPAESALPAGAPGAVDGESALDKNAAVGAGVVDGESALDKNAAVGAGVVDGESALARFTIVTLGSFPIMLFYSDFSFDIGKFVYHGFDAGYAPWPFKSELSEPLTDAEKAWRIGAAVGASVAVGAIDYLIRQSKAKKARLRREALLQYAAERAGEGEASEAPPERREEPGAESGPRP